MNTKIKELVKKYKYQLSGFGILTLGFWIWVLWGLPNPMRLTTNPSPASTKILDRKGKLIYEVFSDQRRTPVSLKSLPTHVIASTLAAEDRDFYTHSGFSIRGIARAFLSTFFKNNVQGGSTITQQLVKNALLNSDRTIRRKIREFILSMVVEVAYSKDQILEMYLNQVPYGGTAYGIESAAQTYFSKPADKLDLAEAALLAGLPQAPSYYSPFGSHPEESKKRQKYVLDQMKDNNMISDSEYNSALGKEFKFAIEDKIKAPHFALWVKDLLVSKYGLQKVQESGLVVTTTLDLDIQKFAQDAVATEVAKLKWEKVGNGAALVTAPKSGQILAMVGSKDYFDIKADGNVNVTLASRQPGSAIKPINYALALDRKLITAASVLADKSTCFTQPDQEIYCPVNYDNQWHGPTQVRFALANSFNIPAVKALVINGLADFVASASAFGIASFKDPTKYGPSLTLGGGEVTMLEMATAYGVLANTGQKVNLNPILEIRNLKNEIIEKTPSLPSNKRVISAGAAFITSHLLFDNGARTAAFGSNSYLVINGHPEVSVKTGTTNDKRDNWTIGYTPDYLVAVWVGNNDNTPMSNVASGVTGASPIWNKIMSSILKGKSIHWPTQPPEVIGAMVCSLSGLRAPETPPSNCSPRYEYFLTGTLPAFQTDEMKRDILVGSEYQNHTVIFDALGLQLCLDCAGGYGEADIIKLDRNGRAIKR